MHIDTFQHHLLYHRRYINYLTKFPTQKGIHIGPENFKGGLLQEIDALTVLDHRLTALRERTTAILETVSIYIPQLAPANSEDSQPEYHQTRQARRRDDAASEGGRTNFNLSGRDTETFNPLEYGVSTSNLCRRKAKTAVHQTVIMLIILQTLFSMNNAQYADGTAWPFRIFIGMALGFLTLTMLIAVWRWKDSSRLIPSGGRDLQIVHATGEEITPSLVKRRLGFKFKFRPNLNSSQSGDIP